MGISYQCRFLQQGINQQYVNRS
uniref:Uncharacterized protein n=1 Tax=Arundo donax TaxID=35708 RepID=A0A0A8YDV9_ARUDO